MPSHCRAFYSKGLSTMPPKAPRSLQPTHLSSEDAWMVLCDYYPEDLLEDVRKNKGRLLPFEYKYRKRASHDEEALYKHRQCLTGFSKKNSSGVWKWSLILDAMKKWDRTTLGKVLSDSHQGLKAVEQSATNLLQMLQDVRKVKRNMKTSARTPDWLMAIIRDLVVKPEGGLTTEESRSGGSHLTTEESRSGGSLLIEGSPYHRRTSAPENPPRLKRKRTLRMASSTTSEEHLPLKKGLLAIEDKKDEAEQKQDDDIEDTNSDPILYDWDDVTNKGKRLKPPGRWVICQRQEKDRASGFMKCFWETDAGEEEAKIMDMTIYEYEKVEELSCKACMKKACSDDEETSCKHHEEAMCSDKEETWTRGFASESTPRSTIGHLPRRSTMETTNQSARRRLVMLHRSILSS